jgi:hypothetical protein
MDTNWVLFEEGAQPCECELILPLGECLPTRYAFGRHQLGMMFLATVQSNQAVN